MIAAGGYHLDPSRLSLEPGMEGSGMTDSRKEVVHVRVGAQMSGVVWPAGRPSVCAGCLPDRVG